MAISDIHLHDVDNDTYAPVVDLFTVPLALDDLGSNVIWGTTGSCGELINHETRQTEIGYFDRRMFILR